MGWHGAAWGGMGHQAGNLRHERFGKAAQTGIVLAPGNRELGLLVGHVAEAPAVAVFRLTSNKVTYPSTKRYLSIETPFG
jgi:hypothetical protein